MPITYITKADGEREAFDAEKLRGSLSRSGASPKTIDAILSHIGDELREGATTTEIYAHAFSYLTQHEEAPVAARYSLKRAIFDLGPSGFPFEQFVAALLRAKGYRAETGLALTGKCAPHEVDVLAEKGGRKMGIEVKFHNTPGTKTDLKDALYVFARFEDLKATHDDRSHVDEGWLVTNTRFTRSAIRYGRCAGLNMLGWDYPHNRGLLSLIEETGLHPLTCLTTLPDSEKRMLLDKNIVLCRDIKTPHLLESYGIGGKRAETVLKEAAHVCVPIAPSPRTPLDVDDAEGED